MPKKPIDFSRTIIYHFVCNDPGVVSTYVGHTTDIIKRRYGHKNTCDNVIQKGHNQLVYKTIREFGGWGNWKLVPLEEFPCENKSQALIREQHWIDKMGSQLNQVRAHTPDQREFKRELKIVKRSEKIQETEALKELKQKKRNLNVKKRKSGQ